MANAFFSDLLSTISERSRTLLRRGEPADGKHDAIELLELCEALLSGRGEASGTAMARELLDGYHELDAQGGSPSSSNWRAITDRITNGCAGDRKPGATSRRMPTPAICISPPSRGGRSCSAGSTARRAVPANWCRCAPTCSA